MRSARLRELVNLVMVGVLTAVGFASVYTARENQISSTSLVYAGFFLALFAVAHIGVRAGMPNADPWLLPLAALLCALGLTEIYRLQPTLARDQSVWIVVGLIGFLGLDLRAARPPPPRGVQVLARDRRGRPAALHDGGGHHRERRPPVDPHRRHPGAAG